MTRIFYTCFEHQLPAHAFDRYLRSLPLNLQNDVMRYREWRDKHLVLFGKMLLREGLKYFRADNCTLDTIQYSAFKRPFFNNGIDFNISHTGKCVVCAISDTVKVGIDIEEITPIDILDFQGQWTGAEWSHITRSDSSHLEFFRCWTKKEAVIKGNGKGLYIPLHEIEVLNDPVHVGNESWFLKEINLGKAHMAHLATSAGLSTEPVVERIIF